MAVAKSESAEYGAWKSPISSAMAAENSIQLLDLQPDSCTSISDLQVDCRTSLGSDVIYWMEQRPAEGGRGVISSWSPKTAKTVEWTPKEFNVKTKVHEYGGGAFCVFDGEVFFVNKSDQRIYAQSEPGKAVRPVTHPDSARRFADLHYSEQCGLLFAVCEDRGVREDDAKHEKVQDGCPLKTVSDNYVMAVNPRSGSLKLAVSGSDFYACPRTSLSGMLTWMEWNFPNMPWDDTSIRWAPLRVAGDKSEVDKPIVLAAKNGKKDVAFTYPSFTPGGNILYVSDETDWWNIYITGKDQVNKECLDSQEQDLGHPMWIFGMNPYSASKIAGSEETAIVMTYGKDLILLRLDAAERLVTRKVIETGFRFHCFYVKATPYGCYAAGYDARTPVTLFYVDYTDEQVTKVHVSFVLQLEGYLSEPQEIEFPTGDNDVAYGYFYPPVSNDYHAPPDSKPPVLVKMHGGPTGRSFATLNPKIQYYTSRGFGVLDVNYRGSSGYGRKYRQKLYKKWGVTDAEDAVNGVKYLVEKGLANGRRLCITGGSAGGLSVLNVYSIMTHSKRLRSYMTRNEELRRWWSTESSSHYGVTDMEGLVADTHKFEMRYLDIIVGGYPAQKSVYEERSPICNKEKIKSPVIFFQGLDDAIVPPAQAQKMYDAVKSKGLACALVLFEERAEDYDYGYGRTCRNRFLGIHRLAKAMALARRTIIQKSLDTEYAFFVRVFGIAASHVYSDVVFENLK